MDSTEQEIGSLTVQKVTGSVTAEIFVHVQADEMAVRDI